MGKRKDVKPGNPGKKAKKSEKEDAMDSGLGLPVGEDFVDDFEDVATSRDDAEGSDGETKKPLGRKQLLKAAAMSSAGKGENEGKIKKRASNAGKEKKQENASTFKNRQRVMALSSRGITQRCLSSDSLKNWLWRADSGLPTDIGISFRTSSH